MNNSFNITRYSELIQKETALANKKNRYFMKINLNILNY